MFFAVRGDILIEKPVGVVAGAIYDHTRWTKWTDGLAYSKLLHQARDAKKIVYQAFDLPAVVKDRDVIYAFWIAITKNFKTFYSVFICFRL